MSWADVVIASIWSVIGVAIYAAYTGVYIAFRFSRSFLNSRLIASRALPDNLQISAGVPAASLTPVDASFTYSHKLAFRTAPRRQKIQPQHTVINDPVMPLVRFAPGL